MWLFNPSLYSWNVCVSRYSCLVGMPPSNLFHSTKHWYVQSSPHITLTHANTHTHVNATQGFGIARFLLLYIIIKQCELPQSEPVWPRHTSRFYLFICLYSFTLQNKWRKLHIHTYTYTRNFFFYSHVQPLSQTYATDWLPVSAKFALCNSFVSIESNHSNYYWFFYKVFNLEPQFFLNS